MTEAIEMVEASASVSEVAQKMKSLNVGMLPVLDVNRIVGIVTDRDMVIRGLAEKPDAGNMNVKDIMSPETAHCATDDDVKAAATIMKNHKVRRLVVLDGDKRPAGILSLGDIAIKKEPETITGDTLDAVSPPRH
jgi:CBS domain-containing protein